MCRFLTGTQNLLSSNIPSTKNLDFRDKQELRIYQTKAKNYHTKKKQKELKASQSTR